jgi:peptidoglycan/LPS O-acetylase OafA/YrhL
VAISQSKMTISSARVDGLDLLRLAAVAAVIFYHYGFWGPAAHGVPQVALPALARYAQYGFLGVPVFFIISGFVIAYSAEGRTLVGFGIARFARIYPTFLFCLTLTSVAILFLGGSHFEVTLLQWLANLFIFAPALGQPYVDGAYWSLVIEVIFYLWFALCFAYGLIPKRIDAIIMVWLGITFANELTIDATIFEKIFMADDSGFFAVGLLFYEHYRGRRDTRLYALLVLAIGTSVFQAVHKLEHLGVVTGGEFSPMTVAEICIVSIAFIFWATRARNVPLPKSVVLAVGGITYPLYLLHMQLGYVLLLAVAPARNIELWTAVIISGVVALSWLVWRYAEYPLHTWTKMRLTEYAAVLGLSSRVAVDCPASEPTVKFRMS